MSSLSRVFLVLYLSLLVLALPFQPAQAQQCGGPSIELLPRHGPPSTQVTVNGHDFTPGKLVDIYYERELIATARASSKGAFTIVFTIPECCQGYYRVLANARYTAVDTYFHVTPQVTVSPNNGPVGMTVAVRGQGFASNEAGIEVLYHLDGTYEVVKSGLRADARGSWQTSFQIPSSARGRHKIDAKGDVSHVYEVQEAIFTVTAGLSLHQSWGIVGDHVRVAGSRFAPYEKGIQILLDGQPVVTGIKANGQGEWQASFRVPEMPAGTYDVTAEGEWTKKQDIDQLSFQIKPYVVLSASEGYVGMNLTVTGQGFAASEDVVIQYDGDTVATVRSSDYGSFQACFTVPDSRSGEHLVVSRDVSGNTFTAVFTLESNHPDRPILLLPANNGRVGFIGKVTPTLRWSEVRDDSGVRYSLQISSSPGVTDTGQFIDPIVAVSRLNGTSYTLNATEALSHGTYYWIVQAVDGAGNPSGWTEPRPFRAGLMPVWGFVLMIVGILVLVGVVIRALLRRRAIFDDWW